MGSLTLCSNIYIDDIDRHIELGKRCRFRIMLFNSNSLAYPTPLLLVPLTLAFRIPHRAQAVDQENGFVGRRWVRPEFEAAGPELLREPLVPAGILRHQDGPA